MINPVTPPPGEQPRAAESSPNLQPSLTQAPGWSESVQRWERFRAAWHLLLYLALGAAAVYLLFWMGKSFFPEAAYGAAALWQDMYGELALLLGAAVPAFLMARIEQRPIDDYGLPRRHAFGKMFWVGAVWGLAGITVLLIALRGAHVFFFGHLALHGARIFKFGAFWAVYFLLVALFEEFLMRGYTLFTLSQSTGFWPAAAVLSCLFGAIHLFNRGEGIVGALGAASIGFFFCLTLRRTGTLWFAVGFHMAWDWGETYLYAVPNSGTHEPGHLLSSTLEGPAWLSGGSVGPEGSSLCFIVIAALWIVFDRQFRQVRYNLSPPRIPAPTPTATLYHE